MVKFKKIQPFFTPKQTNLQKEHAKINTNKRATYNTLSIKKVKNKQLSPDVTLLLKEHVDIVSTLINMKWGYKSCDICNHYVREVYRINSHKFCNYGCITIYLKRVGGYEGDVLFDIAWRMY